MQTTQMDLLDLARDRFGWLEGRQRILARNVANANTPNYQPHDAAPFSAALAQFQVATVRTDPNHLSGDTDGSLDTIREVPTERSLDGNAVNIEQQLTAVADTDSQQRLVAGLYGRYMSMFSTVLGKG
ncbi:flagellar basal body rod protein FlgB [Rhizosaccharibacter radicis]|uniref:Flagellar biosynthesis protein FlgB n=1 Tax=Rhizosaccharibacter radicis TaxID=2782605 RepID=A0ABT1W0K1_9PROT|nr:flagellar biosynthesis protein FlgB [Acetobacteraceae bacterium KSS12]